MLAETWSNPAEASVRAVASQKASEDEPESGTKEHAKTGDNEDVSLAYELGTGTLI